ncbi:SDR family NAD(P)-dependent oxidoreductase [Aeromonas diversa]|uniref:SDR family NAD(P)-dependent oxidoreductase n=1 Tax=Aeromonas diversa TaxID=502790 RepID=UPI0034631180
MTQKIVLITGASRGLGRQMARSLAQRGVDLVLTYRSGRAEAEALQSELTALGRRVAILPLDTAECGGFAAFAEALDDTLRTTWGRERLDALVNNAGIGIHVPFVETTEAQFDALMQVHLKGVFFLTQALLPRIEDGGQILNVSTGLARFALPGYAAYAAMKGGVEVLTRYLAKELGGRGIRVNVLAPGAIETDFGGGVVRDNADVNRYIASQTALGRVGLPEDIGNAVAMLLCEPGPWVTGQRIEASGGMFL